MHQYSPAIRPTLSTLLQLKHPPVCRGALSSGGPEGVRAAVAPAHLALLGAADLGPLGRRPVHAAQLRARALGALLLREQVVEQARRGAVTRG